MPQEQQNKGITFVQTVALVCISTVFYSLHGVLTELAKRSNDGELPFNTSALVMVSEVFKMVVSFSLVLYTRSPSDSPQLPTHDDGDLTLDPTAQQQHENPLVTLKNLIVVIDWGMMIPALVYAINNPISFVAFKYMDTATFQALSNLKVITTTLLAWIVFSKKFTPIHWASITLLFVGCLLTTESGNVTSDSALGATVSGLVLMLISAVFSAVAGVAFEYSAKRTTDSLYAQNFKLYLYGMVFNLLGIFAQAIYSGKKIDFSIQLTFWTICIILNQSFTGLLISAVMKYADNIVRLYVIAAATILSTVFAVVVLDMSISRMWVYAASIIGLSIYLYNITIFHSNLKVEYTEPEQMEDPVSPVSMAISSGTLTRSVVIKSIKSVIIVTVISVLIIVLNKQNTSTT